MNKIEGKADEIINYIYSRLTAVSDISRNGFLGYERFLIFDKAIWLDRFINNLPFPPIQIDFQMSSICNLNCRWCVGKYIAQENGMERLSNTLDKAVVKKIVEYIQDLSVDDLSVDTVLFSGLTGEPLLNKEHLFQTIELLNNTGIRMGIFTNGINMGSDTWDMLLKLDSVHISLDGGPRSWKNIKRPIDNQKVNQYEALIDNITGVSQRKKQLGSHTEINIGYTVTLDNYEEMAEVVGKMSELNLNSICLKHDITGADFTGNKQDSERMLKSIMECKMNYDNPSGFRVFVMHETEPTEEISSWTCKNGCYYRWFFCSIGSDGYLYPCDYQTLKEAPKFGNLREVSLAEAIDNKHSNWERLVTNNKKFKNVCPPFANKINVFMQELVELKKAYGSEAVYEAIQRIRCTYS
ncbi:MAG: Radical domain protein [Herbinix sp.]|jgi:sulfatase maturation enzyme AslB (radical SAM superfamily)|nr:Radical domain protein [Herbinix sp.]